jgi:hypothetical protein
VPAEGDTVGPVEIVVEVTPELARALRRETTVEEERAAVGEPQLTLEPLHPGVDDPALACYFVVRLPEAGPAEDVVKRLRERPGVRSAYLKPAGEPP